MDNSLRNLKGSEARDHFKWLHKQPPFPKSCYATDLDLELVDIDRDCIVAMLDFKKPYDRITVTEVVSYNEKMRYWPIYILVSDDFEIYSVSQYNGGNKGGFDPYTGERIAHTYDLIPILENISLDELVEWEIGVRNAARRGEDLRCDAVTQMRTLEMFP